MNLNHRQIEAIESINGPILILAGAGTGKTTVITNRIHHIIKSGHANIDQILAVTFTNKAANEMKERIEKSLEEEIKYTSWIGTFHSMCLRILKMYYKNIGLRENFTIADSVDQKSIINKTLEYLNISNKTVPVKLISYLISRIKNDNVSGDKEEMRNYSHPGVDIYTIYTEYQRFLKELNMVDFDDLIMLCIDILKENNEILSMFQEKFKYVLVDEYQDTNTLQQNLISIIVDKHQNIFCVGDDDQSIYSWRGADISNILNFKKNFPNPKIITLNQNYRSTQNILNFANGIISRNSNRYEKELISNLEDSRPVRIIEVYDDKQEANEITNIITFLYNKGEISARKDVAILVRTTAQMRSIEESFIHNHMPYKIIGGIKFYERKEIKDVIAYLRLLVSDTDAISLERIINIPKRGIGEKTFNSILSFARNNNVSILNALKIMSENDIFSTNINSKVNDLIRHIEETKRILFAENVSIGYICRDFLEKIGYINMLKDEAEEDSSSEKRIDNVNDLLNNVSRFRNLIEFLDHISLINDSDNINNDDVVNIMTIHASKGLEFECVILPGWEEDLLPNRRVTEESGIKGLEEERRLAYVASTRAKRLLYILHTNVRFYYGKFIPCIKSRFITEISEHTYQKINKCNRYGIQKESKRFENPRQNAAIKSYQEIKIGNIFVHPKFGKGIISKILGKFIEIKFEDGMKRIIQL